MYRVVGKTHRGVNKMELYDKKGKKHNINYAGSILNGVVSYTIAYWVGGTYIGLAPTNILEYGSAGIIIAIIALVISIMLNVPVEIVKHYMEDDLE